MTEQRKSIVAFAVFLAILGSLMIWGKGQRDKLQQSHAKTTGIVTGVERLGGRNGAENSLCYSYKVGVIKVVGYKLITLPQASSSFCAYLVGKSFPVMYDPEKPSLSEILIFPKDFKEWDEYYPDSLGWVLKLMEKYPPPPSIGGK